jgi:class 3 adenylate cyclase
MRRRSRIETTVVAALVGGALIVAVVVTLDAWSRVGTVWHGFALMENLQVGVGGAERGHLEPFWVVRALNGRPVASVREIDQEVARHPPGTELRYTVQDCCRSTEVVVPTRRFTWVDFKQFLVDGLVPGLLLLGMGAAVISLKPERAESRLFLGFCLVSAVVALTYTDFNTTHRFSRLFLAAWALSPAMFAHLALTFPEPRAVVRRHPWIVAVPHVVAGALGLWLLMRFMTVTDPIAEIIAPYWGLALIALLVSLAATSKKGATPLVRQRARVLLVAFAVGYLPPVVGTATEVVFRVGVPYLNLIWKLRYVFPLAVAYAILRYQLFDIRAMVRMGVIYSAVTGLVLAGYVGLLTALNLLFAGVEPHLHPLVPASMAAAAVVLLLNPLYSRIRELIDRLFFRARYDARQTLERLAEAMTTALELPRVVSLISTAVDEVLHPKTLALLLADEGRTGYRDPQRTGSGAWVAEPSPLVRCLDRRRASLTRDQLEGDPDFRDDRDGCLAALETLGAELIVPIQFRERMTGLLAVGPRRSGVPYTTEDVRLLRGLVHQSAVALENAKAYSALQAALRRVELLESVRANLAKFVPRAVQDLIERAPHDPALAKQDRDVSIVFVDMVGYTRLSERLDAIEVNEVVERYFGAFLDEILEHGGDVNETAGDGLMVIFQDANPDHHAWAAVLTALGVLRQAQALNADPRVPEPVSVRLAVNSGVAAVGATKIEGRAGARWTYTASGPVTNVAARLAGLGIADVVLIGPETRRRLGDGLPVDDLGEHRLKNVEEAVRVFRLTLDSATQVAGLAASASR